jgi:GGDEF domain-containing protein
MQGRNQAANQVLSRVPKREDLESLLRAAQSSKTPVQQTIILAPSERRFLLRVQGGKGGTSLGKGSNLHQPTWTLIDGVSTLWQHKTFDTELILNLLEESLSPALTGAGSAAQSEGSLFSASAANFSTSTDRSDSQQFRFQAEWQLPAAAAPAFNGGCGANSANSGSGAQQPPGLQMSGNLSEVAIGDLFQSIAVGRMTGRLDVTSGLESLEVYFEEGVPRRASFRSDSMTGRKSELVGEEVILEGLTWKNGFFQFNPSMKSSERNPMRRLDMLLLEGAALMDYQKVLDEAGIHAESQPQHLGQRSEAEFEKILLDGVPTDMKLQKQMYVAFNGKATLADVVTASGLSKTVWLPLVFNLVNCGLIGCAAAPVQSREQPQSPVMKEAVKEAFRELLRADTGLVSYPLMLHFIDVEFKRALRLRQPVSLVLLTVHKEGNGVVEQLSSADLKLISERMRTWLEPYDLVGHYQSLDIAILLPHRSGGEARHCVREIIAKFDRELTEAGNQVRFVWAVGLGCVPENGVQPHTLVQSAEKEKQVQLAARV